MSFGWNCMFRKGSWIEFRRFALLQRQNVASRITYINKELENIGNVSITYELDSDGQATEKRTKISVNTNSSLGKLVMAYVAQGGNPLDISMFLKPDSYTVELENEEVEIGEGIQRKYTSPSGGVVFPESQKESSFKGINTRGWLPLWKYPPRKLGGDNVNIFPKADEVGGQIHEARKWITQEINQLRNSIEHRIIKLCDLREQLFIERDDIIYNALAGSVAILEDFTFEDFEILNYESHPGISAPISV